MIEVRFFARLREEMGTEQKDLPHAEGMSVAQVWQQATGQNELPSNILMAVNQAYAQADSAVNDGDEVAFFPPVTGG